ncbi:uracil phosphoribosyltransferase [Algibacter agarivorans]|uniref:Uracil phosphoribosyltransferase n=1 Tax=Algibacter agarivorans TaxID=1109741 RepID=A0ABP9GFT5_9FLAO
MKVHDFSHQNSIINQFMAELRDVNTQKDMMRFRKNIERIGEIFGYELSKTLSYKPETITTPLGTKDINLPLDELVLCSVLRAGLPLHKGLLNVFDKSENGFISAYRKHKNNKKSIEIVVEYLAAPNLDNKTLLLIDPMLATGKTLENVFNALKNHGNPKRIHIVSVIGSKPGVAYVNSIFPKDTQLWIASIDNTLDQDAHIVPGLGDAGDLSFGLKLKKI